MKYHIGEAIATTGMAKLNPVRMDYGQAVHIADRYNRAALDEPRVVIIPCDAGMCCLPEDADISGRGEVFVDVLGRGTEA